MMRASAVIASGIGAAERPAVLRLIQHADLDHAVGDAADARRDRGDARPVVPGVADHGHVGAEQIRVPLHELGEVGGGALLLALDQELHRDGHVVPERPQRGGVDHDPRLVVGGAAPVQAAVADLGFERRRVPLLERAFRLDVVVGVQQDGRRALRPVDLAEHRRVPAVELQEPGVRHPAAMKMSRVASADARTFAGSSPGYPFDGIRTRRSRSAIGLRHAGRDACAERRRRSWARTIPQATARVAPRASRSPALRRACIGSGRGAGTRAPARTRSCRARCGSRPRTAAAERRRPDTSRRTP